MNYAELNDVYLPPLGPDDVVGRGEESGHYRSVGTRRKRIDDSYIQQDYLAPRVRNTSRRFRGQLPELATVKETEEASDPSPSPNHTLQSGVLMLGKHQRDLGDCESGSGSSDASVGEDEDGGHEGDDEQESEGSLRVVNSYSSSRCGSEDDSDELIVEMPLPPGYGVAGHGLNQYTSLGMVGPRISSVPLANELRQSASQGATHTPHPRSYDEAQGNHWSNPTIGKTLEYMLN